MVVRGTVVDILMHCWRICTHLCLLRLLEDKENSPSKRNWAEIIYHGVVFDQVLLYIDIPSFLCWGCVCLPYFIIVGEPAIQLETTTLNSVIGEKADKKGFPFYLLLPLTPTP